jgi:hypothetical protein
MCRLGNPQLQTSWKWSKPKPERRMTMLRKSWILAIATMAVALVVNAATVAEKASGPLDGKTFVGETGEKGKDRGDIETFVFRNGQFDPLQCHPYGFGPAPYTASSSEGEVRFEAETVSAEEGKMLWKGTVRGSSLQGTMVWTKEGQAPIEYWFRGQQKN